MPLWTTAIFPPQSKWGWAFVSHGAPPGFFRYTGTEPLFAIDLSFRGCGEFPVFLPEEILQESVGSNETFFGEEFRIESVLQLYSVRSATPEERKNVFALYDVKAKTTTEARKPKGQKPKNEKEDEEIFDNWLRASIDNPKLTKKEFWQANYYKVKTCPDVEKIIARTARRRNRRLRPKRR